MCRAGVWSPAGPHHLGRVTFHHPAARHVRNLVRRLTAMIVLGSVLALLASGCGGASAEEKWADSVCSAVGDWQDTVENSVNDVKTQLQSPTTGTTAAINTDIESAVNATKNLSSDLKSIDPPSSDAGKHAKQQLTA